ncbi:competence protein ComGC [Virgibacillus natechei]|uniref:Competence protein ComGC n=1 Tax=Virgibacillus natechei TaxID=1216297 RepID=A0ABS4IKA7_9BACI|nr:hypothetical protein [Virgibacillus natechei]MBP1971407.1 competence protein ComGC [Virgibacillus natechei]UZD12225.1 hypothetical protein OLD84_15000 [Virgibacillus natechei]
MESMMESKLVKPVTLLLIMSMLILLVTPAVSAANAQDAAEEEKNAAMQLIEYVEKDKAEGIYFFDKDRAIKDGVASETIAQLQQNFEKLTMNQQGLLYDVKQGDLTTQAWPAVVAAFLAGAVAGWLIEGLLDYGVNWLCDNYKYYNSATQVACDIWG